MMILAVVMVAGCASAASGINESGVEKRKVKAFTKIRLEGPVEVYYSQGKTASVEVKAPAKHMKDVRTYVDGQTLVVSLASTDIVVWRISGRKGYTNKIEVYVTSPDLIGVNLNGSGNFVCSGRLDTDNLGILLRGSGDITFNDIICDNIRTELVGSGDINLKKVDALSSEVILVGSGDIGISQKNVRKTTIDLKGSGDISVSFNSCGAVESELKGSGDISLSGTVKSFSKRAIGSGDYHTGRLTVRK